MCNECYCPECILEKKGIKLKEIRIDINKKPSLLEFIKLLNSLNIYYQYSFYPVRENTEGIELKYPNGLIDKKLKKFRKLGFI